MSCEHGKRKKLPGLLKKQYFVSNNREKPRFSSIFPRISKTRRTKVFTIIKGNFSALAVKRIREKSKNDPPYWIRPTGLEMADLVSQY
jgi:hypothetical protein